MTEPAHAASAVTKPVGVGAEAVGSAYLAAEGYEAPLAEELVRRGVTVSAWHGRLALSSSPPVGAAWAQDIWTEPREIAVPSVTSAADALRAMQRNWAAYSAGHRRRMALIAGQLPPVRARLLGFPEPVPSSHLGAWTLLAPDRMLASATKFTPFVNGECRLEEDHIGPPSRAYLKLREALARFGQWPAPGDRCCDLGASPGAWTWVLAKLGASVTALDKAPLSPAVAAMPGVTQRLESAFAMPPEPVDWLCSDVIAYPDRLLSLVRRWIDSGAARHIACTIKFQGRTDHDAAEAFAAIPDGQVVHLFHNKHELTFLYRQPEG